MGLVLNLLLKVIAKLIDFGLLLKSKSRLVFFDFLKVKRVVFFAELGVVILVFVVVGLGCVKVYCWKKSRRDDHEWEKLIGDLESL